MFTLCRVGHLRIKNRENYERVTREDHGRQTIKDEPKAGNFLLVFDFCPLVAESGVRCPCILNATLENSARRPNSEARLPAPIERNVDQHQGKQPSIELSAKS